MKKACVALALGLVLALAAVACGSSEPEPSASSPQKMAAQQHGAKVQPREEAELERELGQETEQARHRREEKKRKARKKKKAAEEEAKGTQEEALSGVATITAEEFEQFRGTDLGNWEIAYSICAVTPESQLAREYHTRQDFGSIGHAMGSEYKEPFNIAVEEGCMAALVDSPAEREAAFKMMEAAEAG